jgi:hypothetical protein
MQQFEMLKSLIENSAKKILINEDDDTTNKHEEGSSLESLYSLLSSKDVVNLYVDGIKETIDELTKGLKFTKFIISDSSGFSALKIQTFFETLCFDVRLAFTLGVKDSEKAKQGETFYSVLLAFRLKPEFIVIDANGNATSRDPSVTYSECYANAKNFKFEDGINQLRSEVLDEFKKIKKFIFDLSSKVELSDLKFIVGSTDFTTNTTYSGGRKIFLTPYLGSCIVERKD